MKAVIADDQPSVRAALRLIIQRQTNIKIMGEAADTDELLLLLSHHPIDLVLVDWELPDLSGADYLSLLRLQFPDVRVLILSGDPDAQKAALEAGADAFCSKTEAPERLLAVLKKFS